MTSLSVTLDSIAIPPPSVPQRIGARLPAAPRRPGQVLERRDSPQDTTAGLRQSPTGQPQRTTMTANALPLVATLGNHRIRDRPAVADQLQALVR